MPEIDVAQLNKDKERKEKEERKESSKEAECLSHSACIIIIERKCRHVRHFDEVKT